MANLTVYTTNEVLDILKVTKRTLYNYIKAGQLKAVKVGRDWRISEEALEDFLARGTDPNYLEKLEADRQKVADNEK